MQGMFTTPARDFPHATAEGRFEWQPDPAPPFEHLPIQLDRLRKRLAERHITLAVTPEALRSLGRRGYDPTYGARPLKRLIQQEIETPLARQLVKGELRDGETATVDLKNGQTVIVPTLST